MRFLNTIDKTRVSFGKFIDFIKIKTALKNYLESDRVKKGFIQNGSTWFNDWQGWLEVKTQSILDKYEVHK